MSTAADLVASFRPPTLEAKDIPAKPEIEMRLYRASQGNYRNQYRGRLDKAGTVRARVYIGGEPEEHRGEILVGTTKDITGAGFTGKNDEVAYFEYDNTLADNTLVIVWLPKEAKHEGVKVLL